VFAWACIIAAAIMTIALVITALHHAYLETPYVRTSRALAKAMAELAGIGPHDHVYDLGAGDGSILLEAKRMQPGIRATGIEIVPMVWLLGWLRTRTKGIRFLLRDACKTNVSDASVVFLYMTPHMLKRMEHTFATLKPGAKVVSRAFHLGGKTPAEQRTVRGTTLFLYRW
jgi:precorrin-6B methylase 2